MVTPFLPYPPLLTICLPRPLDFLREIRPNSPNLIKGMQVLVSEEQVIGHSTDFLQFREKNVYYCTDFVSLKGNLAILFYLFIRFFIFI